MACPCACSEALHGVGQIQELDEKGKWAKDVSRDQLSPHLHLVEQNSKEPEYSVSEPGLLGSSTGVFVKVGG